LKSRKAVVLVALVGVALLPVTAIAQQNPPEMPRPEAGLGLLSYERFLEESLDRNLSAYLGPEHFIIQVKALLAEPEAIAVRAPQAPIPQTPVNPPLPALGMVENDSDEPPVLPGLSSERARPAPQVQAAATPPPSWSPPVAAAPEREFAERKIERLRVSVVLPSSLTSKDEDFIRNMITQKVDHQFARDLDIDITRRDFPTQTGAAPMERSLPSWVWLLLAGAGGLGLGWLVSRRRPAPESAAATVQLSSGPSAPVASGADSASSNAEALRHELTMLLLSEPELAERYMGQLLAQELGMERAAILVRTLGTGVSRRLFPGVSDELWRTIELSRFERGEVPVEEVQQAMAEAIRAISRDRHAAGGRTTSRRRDPFAFLEVLEDSQLLFVLQEESPRVQALVYSQLPPHRAIGLMQLMNPGELGATMAAMGDLSAIPMAAFQDIALHLARKASEAPRFSTSVTNGIELLVGLLDHSDRQMEQRILQELSTQNPQVLQQVKQSYLAFDDIPKIRMETLRDAVRDFPREQLAEVLRDAPADVVAALTGALNVRGRQVVDEALAGPSLLDADPAARDAMRRDLLNRIRQTSRVMIVPKGEGN